MSSQSGNSKSMLISQIRQESALANAKILVDKINKHCFVRCVNISPTSPGSSPNLTSSETKCFSICLQKYLNSWNTVSHNYVERLQSEASVGR